MTTLDTYGGWPGVLATLAAGRDISANEASRRAGGDTRHRLNRRGDRQLNRALHTIAVTRSRYCPHTQASRAKRPTPRWPRSSWL